ncbi:MAG: menaquinone biosynthesis protein [Candidatus Latescibacterota bacterium]|nr:menaquinone biosynthesis protein [Candidatus Latescibacterota bacterium]
MKLSVGAVSYLNSRPLVKTLSEVANFDIDYSVPSVCASELMTGAVDVALIPSIEYARSEKQLYIVPDLAIAANGPALTVRFYYNVDIMKVRRVAIDRSSRTSAALLKIILLEKYGVEPEWIESSPCLEEMLRIADAALMIGDPVFPYLGISIPYIDLAEEWNKYTGLPFVFAFWAGWPGVINQTDVHKFFSSSEMGQKSICEIAADYAEHNGGDTKLYERYMREYIHYDLGDRELEGLNLFYEKAVTNGIIERVPQLVFYGESDV